MEGAAEAIGLTVALAVVHRRLDGSRGAGPTLADKGPLVPARIGIRADVEYRQWPLVIVIVSVGIALIYYFAPDANRTGCGSPRARSRDGALAADSLGFRLYVTNFGAYRDLRAIGGVIVVMLWFYLSGWRSCRAELNAEIEHASPYGKTRREDTGRA